MSTSSEARDESRAIGPYRTLRELGRGGQAIVWLAEDTRIKRQVALKVLPSLGPGGEEALSRFRREAEVASRLEHPGICSVLEADLDQGMPYIAMRYVAGETIAKRLAAAREGGDPPPDRERVREIVHLFEKAARALHAAHEAGVIHRDVKPANVMVTPEGEPVILDFGLARQDDGEAHALTITGEAHGTPAYMSPEQMTGRSRPDRRTDVWSLGIALHECATLRHPFEAATREGNFQAILSEDPPDPRRANRAVDRDLATILETATAKERDRRYLTALRERNPELWGTVHGALRNLDWLGSRAGAQEYEPVRDQTLRLVQSLPGFAWPELERAERRWDGDRVDDFDVLLTETALEGRSTDQLSDLAGALLSMDGRLRDAWKVLERALESDPGSFRLHYLVGAVGFMPALEVKESDPVAFRQRAAKVLHHMQVAAALRPRSGFVRAMLANALAMDGKYLESTRCIEEATELEPGNALVWLLKARYYGYTPWPDRGVAACKVALELDRDLGGARELLAELEAKTAR